VNGSKLTVGNVGDSRVYHWHDGSLLQVTIDDTWVNAISGRDGPKINVPRNLLTQAAGTKDMVDVHTSEIEVDEGDLVLLCSDGLYSLVPDQEIAASLNAGMSLSATAAELLRAAKSAGGDDNISIILLKPEE
jgi:PPM family protein phosphatase